MTANRDTAPRYKFIADKTMGAVKELQAAIDQDRVLLPQCLFRNASNGIRNFSMKTKKMSEKKKRISYIIVSERRYGWINNNGKETGNGTN